MIQVMYTDGTRERFSRAIVDRGKKIAGQKILTDEEISMVPEMVKKKLVMRKKNSDELAIEKAKRDKAKRAREINQKIESRKRKMAVDSLVSDGVITEKEAVEIGG